MIVAPVNYWRVVTGPGAIDLCLHALERDRAATITRDVIVGMPGDGTPLIAEVGDLWFHSDGTFLECPPRWVVVQAQEAEEDGEVEVLDFRRIAESLPRGPVWFGQAGTGVSAQIVERTDTATILRYRRDYMTSMEGGPDLSIAHAQVKRWASEAAEVVSPLAPGDCLVLDNWAVLHRRRAFRGRRVIRRLWLTEGT